MTSPKPAESIPDQRQIVWRYMSFSRFMWMLQTRNLWLARVDTFDDEWEMALAGAQLQHVLSRHPVAALGSETTETGLERAKRITAHWRNTTFASCWSGFGPESHALWRLYCGQTEGIAIRTTLLSLKKALPRLDIQRVTYRSIGNYRQTPTRQELVFTKRVAFEYENEIRIVATNETQDPTLNKGEFGFRAAFDIERVIQQVCVHPGADQSFFDVVVAAIGHYAPALVGHVGWSHMRHRPPLMAP